MENGRLKTMNLARKRNVFHFNPLYGVLWGINIINVELKLGQAPSLPALTCCQRHVDASELCTACHAFAILYVYIYTNITDNLLTSDGKGCYLIMMTSSITRCSEDQLQLLPNVAYAVFLFR